LVPHWFLRDIDGYRFTIVSGNTLAFEIVTDQNDIVEPGTTKLFVPTTLRSP